jgi:hypothetical protein
MSRFLLTVSFALIAAGLVTTADDKPTDQEKGLSDQEKAAKDFAFEKVKLGITLAEFKKRFPKATLNEDRRTGSDPKLKLVYYAADSESANACGYLFLDGKLFGMRIWYDVKTTDKMGGWIVILDKLKDKFGKVEDAHVTFVFEEKPLKVDATWSFPKVEREIHFWVGDDKATWIDVMDTKLVRELNARRKKVYKTGFDD